MNRLPPQSWPSRRAVARAALLAVIGLGASACGPGKPPGGPRNVVLICLDTVRADHLGLYGHGRGNTPHLDELAARSLVFDDASSTAGWTKPSVPSFLTGTFPCQHGVYEGSARGTAGEETDVLPQSALTLAEAFQQAGYGTGAFVHNAQLRAGNGFEQGFDTYRQENWDAREIRWHGLDWLDEREGDRPFFLYLHFLDAHWPYPAPEEYATRYAPAEAIDRFRDKDSKALIEAMNDGDVPITAEDQAALEALYDGALAYLDSELGRLWQGLEQRGLAEDTVVCVVADHGEEFGEHGKVGHGHGLWQGLLHVPWILHRPGSPAGRVQTPVSLIDLFPTLLSAAGLGASPGMEGVDRLAQPDLARAIFAEHKAPDRYFQSLRDGSSRLERRFRAPPAEGPVLEYPLEPGSRWEVEFEAREEGLLATQLKPRDEDPDDPVELKGRITSLDERAFLIGGLRVLYDEASERQTAEDTAGPELEVGLVVKVRGQVADQTLRAERIKFYSRDENDVLEVRGPVQRIEQQGKQGRLSLGGFDLVLGPETELKNAKPRGPKRRLEREQIVQILEQGGSSAAESGYEFERLAYDLGADPGEQAPLSAPGALPFDQRLDALGAALVQKRLFGAGDRRTLDEAALRALRDIGY